MTRHANGLETAAQSDTSLTDAVPLGKAADLTGTSIQWVRAQIALGFLRLVSHPDSPAVSISEVLKILAAPPSRGAARCRPELRLVVDNTLGVFE